jgi:hypothetical protein
MTVRLLIAYLLIFLLVSGGAATIWWLVHNTERQKLKRYYKAKHDHSKH